jgi:hypothetical protein
MTTKLHNASRTKRDQVAATRMTFTTHVIDLSLEHLLEDIDVTDGPVVLEIRTPSGRSQRVQIRPNLLIPPHHDAGWGTCDVCGTVNVAVTADRLCANCR